MIRRRGDDGDRGAGNGSAEPPRWIETRSPSKRESFILFSMFCMLASVVALTYKAYEAKQAAMRVDGRSGVGENALVGANPSGVGANALVEIKPHTGGPDAGDPYVGGNPDDESDRAALEQWKQWPDWASMLAHPHGQFYYKHGMFSGLIEYTDVMAGRRKVEDTTMPPDTFEQNIDYAPVKLVNLTCTMTNGRHLRVVQPQYKEHEASLETGAWLDVIKRSGSFKCSAENKPFVAATYQPIVYYYFQRFETFQFFLYEPWYHSKGTLRTKSYIRLNELLHGLPPNTPIVLEFAESIAEIQTFMMVSMRMEAMGIDARRVIFLHWMSHLLRCNEFYPGCTMPAVPMHMPMAGMSDNHTHMRHMFWNQLWWKLLVPSEADMFTLEDGSIDEPEPLPEYCKADPGHCAVCDTKPNSTFLLLGGDHRKNRVRSVMALWRKGLLKDASWSLQTPTICGEKPHPALIIDKMEDSEHDLSPDELKRFCKLFPKQLDKPLGSNVPDNLMPPLDEFYIKTRYSVVFETCGAQLHMLTEKVLKPIGGGHPFITVCAEESQLAVGEDFGFDMFRKELNTVSAEQYNMRLDRVFDFDCVPTNADIVRHVERLNLISAEPANPEWRNLALAAAANKRHYHCGGFKKRLMERAIAVLNQTTEIFNLTLHDHRS